MIYRGDVAPEVTKLEQEDGGNFLLLGHGRLGAHWINDKRPRRRVDRVELFCCGVECRLLDRVSDAGRRMRGAVPQAAGIRNPTKKQTRAAQQAPASFDRVIGAGEKARWYGEAQRHGQRFPTPAVSDCFT
jgi:hypothetical protein